MSRLAKSSFFVSRSSVEAATLDKIGSTCRKTFNFFEIFSINFDDFFRSSDRAFDGDYTKEKTARYLSNSFVDIDCKVSKWSTWSKCTKICGKEKRTRSRKILVPPKNDGKKCPPLKTRAKCRIPKRCPGKFVFRLRWPSLIKYACVKRQ